MAKQPKMDGAENQQGQDTRAAERKGGGGGRKWAEKGKGGLFKQSFETQGSPLREVRDTGANGLCSVVREGFFCIVEGNMGEERRMENSTFIFLTWRENVLQTFSWIVT